MLTKKAWYIRCPHSDKLKSLASNHDRCRWQPAKLLQLLHAGCCSEAAFSRCHLRNPLLCLLGRHDLHCGSSIPARRAPTCFHQLPVHWSIWVLKCAETMHMQSSLYQISCAYMRRSVGHLTRHSMVQTLLIPHTVGKRTQRYFMGESLLPFHRFYSTDKMICRPSCTFELWHRFCWEHLWAEEQLEWHKRPRSDKLQEAVSPGFARAS